MYLFHKRVVQYPLLQAFDAPDAQQSCGRRMNTTVAPQALALLNDPFVRRRAEEFASRLANEAPDDVDDRIALAFELGLGRGPSPEELSETKTFLAAQAEARRKRNDKLSPGDADRLALVDLCQTVFALNEFVYVD